MLFYTGSSRLSSDFAKKLINNLEANAKHMTRMHEMVEVGGRYAACRQDSRSSASCCTKAGR